MKRKFILFTIILMLLAGLAFPAKADEIKRVTENNVSYNVFGNVTVIVVSYQGQQFLIVTNDKGVSVTQIIKR